jgi:transcriptional regulator with GAF, ATPase, and Fis domain
VNPDALQEAALRVANSRTLCDALESVVHGLAKTSSVALVRIWLIGEGDRCSTCALAEACTSRTRCLHLSASQGLSRTKSKEQWTKLNGDFSRIPLNEVRKVGYVATHGLPVFLPQVSAHESWVARPEWIEEEKIVSFAGQPLISGGETLGAIGVFSRALISKREMGWLRTFADRVAVSIINARAFDEIAELRKRLEAERDYLRKEVNRSHSSGSILGSSHALENLLQKIELVAPTDTSVLLLGESGTGKELAACAIHQQSPRKDRTLVRVNCASIPSTLFESEFFGHVKGSFSGAVRDRVGRFQLAEGGTIFLDEIGEIPLDLQSKLLRVLQEGSFERVGDEKTTKVNVRVIAATNRDLKAEVAAGRFREDLYYRLSVFPLEVPPLRERIGDIPPLAQHFLDEATTRMNRGAIALTVAQVRALESYSWPGNIRELQNLMERGAILSSGRRIPLDELLPTAIAKGSLVSTKKTNDDSFVTDIEMLEMQRTNLVAALRHAKGKVSGPTGAAALLGLQPTTLASRIKKLNISPSEYTD